MRPDGRKTDEIRQTVNQLLDLSIQGIGQLLNTQRDILNQIETGT